MKVTLPTSAEREIHKRRGGKQTQGNRHKERDGGEHASEEREEGEGEEGGRKGERDRGGEI